MRPEVGTIYGPNPVQKTGTVTVPRPLLRAIGADPADGAQVHWALNPAVPGTLVLIPTALDARASAEILRALQAESS